MSIEEYTPEHVWGMALHSFREATRTITEMARSPDYRDFAVEESGEIAEVVLAANLMWSMLEKRKAA